MGSSPLLEVKGLSKAFPGVQALSLVDFDVDAGEVHCLIGENGAGKSTLVKILAGAQPQDAGSIVLDGKEVSFSNPLDAQLAGIACIFQELNVVGGLTIAENIVLGSEPTRMGFFDKGAAQKIARELLTEIGFSEIDETQICGGLSTSEKQAVMIAKALRQNAKIIIMDEPTSPLEDAEVRKLFNVIQKLKLAGKGIIYVSHKMREIDELGDRITVFKDGARVATVTRGEANSEDLVRLMVGRQINEMFPEKTHTPGDVVLKVTQISGPKIRNVSLEVRRGEVLGVGGLDGAGRNGIVEIDFRCRPCETGFDRG